jgi:uncharacterized membrane protein YfhO
MFYPGWVALIDGKEEPIYQTNYLLRGVFLPSGNHKVEMYYSAPLARKGLMISLFTLVTLALLIVVAITKRVHEIPEVRDGN